MLKSKEEIRKYKKVISLLETAAKELDDIQRINFCDTTAIHFKHEIEELLSCDHGEAGLKPFVDVMNCR